MGALYHAAFATAGRRKLNQQGEFVFCQNYQTSKMSDWTLNQKSLQENNFIPKDLSLGHWTVQRVGRSHLISVTFFAECGVAEIIRKIYLSSHKCTRTSNPNINNTLYLFIVFGADTTYLYSKKISSGQYKCFGLHQKRRR